MKNNLILKQELSLNSLTSGQQELYKVVVEKIELDQPITIEDARQLYIKYGCKDVRNGIPYTSPDWENRPFTKDDFLPMNKVTLNMYSSGWFKFNLGSLVTKGFLKVIPMINLKIKDKEI